MPASQKINRKEDFYHHLHEVDESYSGGQYNLKFLLSSPAIKKHVKQTIAKDVLEAKISKETRQVNTGGYVLRNHALMYDISLQIVAPSLHRMGLVYFLRFGYCF